MKELFGNETVWKVLEYLGVYQEANAHALAEFYGLNLSVVQRQLCRLERGGLVEHARVGRTNVYKLNPSNPCFAQLKELVLRIHENEARKSLLGFSEEEVRLNLAELGMPLFVSAKKPHRMMSAEQALVAGLALARQDGTVASLVPIVLFRNFTRVDFRTMERLAEAVGETKSLRFFAELTSVVSGEKLWRQRFRKGARTEEFFRRPQGEFQRKLSKQRTPALARKAGFTMNMPLEAFANQFQKFQGVLV